MQPAGLFLEYSDLAKTVDGIVSNVERAVSGKRDAVSLAVVAMLAGGHILIEDVPGVGKTLLAKSLARSIGGEFRRIQFTPDLLPSDVSGLNIYNQGERRFEFWEGPVFANVVLADEINRASPKTQSALLEAMEENSVTVDGETRRLEEPFGVIATQNPVEHEGTYPLPHAELDRFMVKMALGYPDEDAEMRLLKLSGDPSGGIRPVVGLGEFLQMRRLVGEVHASEAVLRYIVSVTSATRERDDVALGASPRASRMLLAAAKARAASGGRSYCTPDDVKALAAAVLSHRIIPASGANSGGAAGTSRRVVHEVLRSVPVTEAV
ncbi:MoxR-like ATPase [Rubrobacter radiotolerans]|uniref:MoxR family ATPase n=1 Tax=Rubrobacter radiotolerans TaxID=42256 RepID=A0A023X5U0_RUBRA|nr:MoxR family ATPase [Rubrobacter radiotolerans]AHY47703.1 MoxR-like ATPase [Rubrobacter radiotolerans]MDX5895106.1 MoxR family ATPase [Rubrobacter radiotolerans]SMC07466.1 MoxR-like ATPase [Rubrobacter radiotolerans DSM 5868]